MAETCRFDIDMDFQEYTSFISYELCYDYPPTYLIYTHNGDDTP